MDIQYVYTRKRNQFGRPTNFSDRPAEILADIVPDLTLLQEFIYRNPVEIGVQHSIQLSEHEANTIRYQSESKGINHTEGGWPKDVNIQEQDQITRHRKKIEKDELYLNSLHRLVQVMEMDIKQDNALDIHPMYFQNTIDESDQPFEAKTVNLYSNHQNINHMANHISWQADGQRKIAVSYGDLDFNPSRTQTIDSLIWDIENPNKPEMILKPDSSLNTIQFNPKDTHQLLAGCLNGQVCLFDLRKGTRPVEQSSIESSHREPVRNAFWVQSKTGNEFFSATTDGNIYWWDTKKMSEPVDTLLLDLDKKGRVPYASAITRLEYDSSIPSKFMVGTETGRIVSCARKAKSDADRIGVVYPGHSGPIHALQRHPFFNKTFLSAADWTVRIWSEEIRDDYILCTRPEKHQLTDAQWCPGRPGVFIASTTEGSIHIWDLLFKQDEPALSIKLSEDPVACLSFHDQGRYVACGTKSGHVRLIELSDSLCIVDRNEKQLVASLFDRETRRTRLLETRSRFRTDQHVRRLSPRSDDELLAELQRSTEQFWSIVNQEKADLQEYLKHIDDQVKGEEN